MVKYTPEVIEEFAEQLYKQAGWIAMRSAAAGILIGLGLGYLGSRFGPGPLTYSFVPLCGWIGWGAGLRRGFRLRLEAQRALVQVKIEENTRRI
jgi:hypothetical protein